jgi:hypothetical protein
MDSVTPFGKGTGQINGSSLRLGREEQEACVGKEIPSENGRLKIAEKDRRHSHPEFNADACADDSGASGKLKRRPLYRLHQIRPKRSH